MNEIQIFNNEEFGSVRTIQIDGEIHFVGKDVAQALGYAKPTDAVRKHIDEEDKGISKIETPSGIQETTVINESGLYSLVLSSKLPNAKKFKRWVTSEVLPSIRKTGIYQTKPMTALEQISLTQQAVLEVNEKIMELDKDLQTFKEEMPVLALDCEQVTNAVKRKGIKLLGGKESNAYKDKSIRGKVYADIYRGVKRMFSVTSYKSLKRNQCESAVEYISRHELPFVLVEEINMVNAQETLSL